MLVKQDMLLVIGSTFDDGTIVAEGQGEDQDGFITKCDTNTGALYQPVRNVARIGQEMDDYITNIVCDDPTDLEHVYMDCASRDDQGNLIDMLYKIRVETLTSAWVQHFCSINLGQNMPATTVALDCTVSGGTVYVAGNVKDGSFMLSSNVQASYGLDDVFVARVNKDDGEVFWTSQIGSSGKERLGGPRRTSCQLEWQCTLIWQRYRFLVSREARGSCLYFCGNPGIKWQEWTPFDQQEERTCAEAMQGSYS
jgi:hypothetical protein